jgi:SAM-dependent methyltransferase
MKDVPRTTDDRTVRAYDEIAERYAWEALNNAYNAEYERPATLSLLPDVRGLRVLDAGCGPGIYSEWLASHGAAVVSVDASREMLRLAEERLGAKVTIRFADLRKPLSFIANSALDLVLAALVFDSIMDWRPLFSELGRILVDNGLVVFSIGHPMAEFELSETKRYFDVELTQGEWPNYGVMVPSYRRPFQDVFDPLLENGFTIEKVLEPRPTEACERIAPRIYKKLNENPWFLCIRARKSRVRV